MDVRNLLARSAIRAVVEKQNIFAVQSSRKSGDGVLLRNFLRIAA